jgi:hypothetical protein
MTHDVIDRLVRPANPVPDPKMLEAVEMPTLDVHRREEMLEQQVEVGGQVVEKRGRGPLIGIAAAVVVLIIGGLVLFRATDGSDVATGRTPVEIATDYVGAYSAFDVERVASMLADGAEVLPWEAWEPRDWQADLRYLEAAGFQLLVGECRENSQDSEGVRVNCEYDAHGLGSDQIGMDPFGGNVFRLVIEDGLVVSSTMGFNFTEFADAMWFPFQSWIQAFHPEDFAVLYEEATLSRQTDDAIALWEQRVLEYVEYVNDQS